MDETAESPPPEPSRPSKTPSWVMLGFLLGALFVWSLQQAPEATPPAAAPPKPLPVRILPPPAPRLMAIEAVFAEWGGAAVWENDVTEVALWTPETKNYTDFYEVVRVGENVYFRSIPHLTRPILNRGVKINSPLQFTETEAHRQEWMREVANENWRALTGGRKDPPDQNIIPNSPPPPPPADSVPPAPRTGTGDGKM